MSITISHQTEIRLTEEARKQGISVDALLERLISERAANASPATSKAPALPVLDLGPMGPLHRRDIYNDVR